MSGVTLTKVIKRYGDVEVIHGIDLGIEDGEFCVFVGPSGCGKSTLLRMIAGLEETSQGEIRIGARDVTRADPAERGVSMVFQTYALYPHMTVEENMGFGLKMNGHSKAEIAEKVGKATAILKLDEYLDRKPKALSGGQRQRVAIGRAIVRGPEVFLFDEPLSNLDAELRVEMRVEIARLHKEIGATMVYVTHDQVEAMTLADKIVVLRAGRDRAGRRAAGSVPRSRQPLRGRLHRLSGDEFPRGQGRRRGRGCARAEDDGYGACESAVRRRCRSASGSGRNMSRSIPAATPIPSI